MAEGQRSLVNQLVVFAVVFTLFQVGFEWLRGSALAGPLLAGILATTAVVTAVYGAILYVVRARKNNRGD